MDADELATRYRKYEHLWQERQGNINADRFLGGGLPVRYSSREKEEFIQTMAMLDTTTKCDRGHCTVEERAVVEAALTRRQIEVEAAGKSTSNISDSGLGLHYYEAAEAERKAVDTLVAVRAKMERK